MSKLLPSVARTLVSNRYCERQWQSSCISGHFRGAGIRGRSRESISKGQSAASSTMLLAAGFYSSGLLGPHGLNSLLSVHDAKHDDFVVDKLCIVPAPPPACHHYYCLNSSLTSPKTHMACPLCCNTSSLENFWHRYLSATANLITCSRWRQCWTSMG